MTQPDVIAKLRGYTTLPAWAQCPISPAEAHHLLKLIDCGRPAAHLLPLLTLTADETRAVEIAVTNYADAMPSDSTTPGMPAFVAALRSALTKLTTTEEPS